MKNIASIGEKANPTEKTDNKRPKVGALHFGGTTSDNEDNAIVIQLTKPVEAPTT